MGKQGKIQTLAQGTPEENIIEKTNTNRIVYDINLARVVQSIFPSRPPRHHPPSPSNVFWLQGRCDMKSPAALARCECKMQGPSGKHLPQLEKLAPNKNNPSSLAQRSRVRLRYQAKVARKLWPLKMGKKDNALYTPRGPRMLPERSRNAQCNCGLNRINATRGVPLQMTQFPFRTVLSSKVTDIFFWGLHH